MLKNKPSRKAVSAEMGRWPRTMSLMRLGGTSKKMSKENEGQVFHYRIPNTNEDAGLGTGCWLKHADARRDFALVLAHNDAHVVFGLQIEPKTRLHAEKQA